MQQTNAEATELANLQERRISSLNTFIAAVAIPVSVRECLLHINREPSLQMRGNSNNHFSRMEAILKIMVSRGVRYIRFDGRQTVLYLGPRLSLDTLGNGSEMSKYIRRHSITGELTEGLQEGFEKENLYPEGMIPELKDDYAHTEQVRADFFTSVQDAVYRTAYLNIDGGWPSLRLSELVIID
jgi:hypothetical protein